MEEFKLNLVRNCKEYGIAPTEALLSELRHHRKADSSSKVDLGPPSLDFSGSSLSVHDCAVLARTLSTDRNIKGISFSDCLLTEESCKLLLNALTTNKGLAKVDFKGNNIRSSGHIVGRILKVTTVLTHLNLEWNGIGFWDDAITSIAEGLQVNQTLRYLDLRNNQISHEGGANIANALKANHVLRVLDLKWNNVGMLGAKSFLNTLKYNKVIVKLDLSGNNIPSEMMKTLECALQRNVDRQASCQEQIALTATYKQRVDNIEAEKNSQISSLVDKLARDKDAYEVSAISAQEKIEQLKMALDQRRSAFSTLEERFTATAEALRVAEQASKRHEEYIYELKEESARRQKDMESTIENLREQLAFVGTTHKEAIKIKSEEALSLEKKNRDLSEDVSRLKMEIGEMNKEMKERDAKYHKQMLETEQQYAEEIETLVNQQNNKKQADSLRLQKLEDANSRLEEELSLLKSKNMSDKLKYEEDAMNMRMTMKQEEMNRTKQFEERIELLQTSRNDVQIKATKQSAEISDLQTRLGNSERENESWKRQCEHLKQQIDDRETELRNETNKARLEIENERRESMELKEKIADLERKNSEQEKRAKENLAAKETEISFLKTQLANKEDEIKRNRNDEIKRTEMLENALQSYLASARK